MNRYRCYYMMPEIVGDTVTTDRALRTVLDDPEVQGLERHSAFIAGFWLNEFFELVTGADDDKKYWIPPGAIEMIALERDVPDSLEWTEQDAIDREAEDQPGETI